MIQVLNASQYPDKKGDPDVGVHENRARSQEEITIIIENHHESRRRKREKKEEKTLAKTSLSTREAQHTQGWQVAGIGMSTS